MPDYSDIDEALAPISEFIKSITVIDGELKADHVPFKLYAERMEIDMPIEMDVIVGEDGETVLGTSAPTQTIETSFMPVFHQLKLTITRDQEYGV